MLLSKSLSRFAKLACALCPLSLASLISHEFFHLQFSYLIKFLRYVLEDMEVLITLEVFTSIGHYELSIGVTKKPCYYSTYLSGELSVIDLAPNVWLHSSVGRALHWEVRILLKS